MLSLLSRAGGLGGRIKIKRWEERAGSKKWLGAPAGPKVDSAARVDKVVELELVEAPAAGAAPTWALALACVPAQAGLRFEDGAEQLLQVAEDAQRER